MDTATQVEIQLAIIRDLEELGCACAGTVEAPKGTGTRAYGISEHFDDCSAVAHYSKPENQPKFRPSFPA